MSIDSDSLLPCPQSGFKLMDAIPDGAKVTASDLKWPKKSEKMKKVRVTEWPLRRDGQHEDSNRTHLADLTGQNCIRQHLHGTIAHPSFIIVRTLLMIHLFRDNAHDTRWRMNIFTRRTVHVVGQSVEAATQFRQSCPTHTIRSI
jgi:hypothetical protein